MQKESGVPRLIPEVEAGPFGLKVEGARLPPAGPPADLSRSA